MQKTEEQIYIESIVKSYTKPLQQELEEVKKELEVFKRVVKQLQARPISHCSHGAKR